MKSKVCKATAALVSVMVSSSLFTSAMPYKAKAKVNSKKDVNVSERLLEKAKLNKTKSVKSSKNKLTGKNAGLEDENSSKKNQEETVRVIVELEEKPAAKKAGSATKASKTLVNSVINDQASVLSKVKKELNITDDKIKNRFGNVINGFSLEVKRKDIAKIKKISGVKKVTEANTYHPTINNAKDLAQIKQVWKNNKYKGEGLVVSIIDSGIDPSHKDMKIDSEAESKIKIKKQEYTDGGKYYTDKVPYGYNFADHNQEIRDTFSIDHGMHVAGIVAANGNEEEVKNGKAVQGIAPNAQLLAMKVFTNNPKFESAFADDIVAAIEKSVELKADVINMSFGSDCGFVDSDDPEQKAIKEATDAGVVCVSSASNASSSTEGYSLSTEKDIGTLGTPGLAEDTIEVASMESSVMTLNALTAAIDGKTSYFAYIQCNIDPIDALKGKNLDVVYCGKGTADDFKGKDVKGKIALVQRGDSTFTEKQGNAQKAGAEAILVFNKDNDESYISMASESTLKIPALFLCYSDGKALKDGKNVKIKFQKGNNVSKSNPNDAEMSSYTSWGPTPDLRFAPEVTAPGGDIYSTLNDNKYGPMSGTSMASPFTAGSTALVLQGAKEKNIGLSGRDLVKFAKNSLVNTAKVLYDKENTNGKVPYSPRRQGAGLIQVENAVDNSVLATGDNGQAVISLKEVGNTTKFNITLKNYGDKSETYTLKTPGGVLTAKTNDEYAQNSQDTELKDSKVTFDKNEVTVPAKGEAKVEATLNIGSGAQKENYAEGYIQFENKDKNTPSLVVPYMGYYGDWSKERVIAPMYWQDNADDYLYNSLPAVEIGGDYYVAGDEKGDKIVISPNNDGYSDDLFPALFFDRNAKRISVDILDKDKKVIAKDVKSLEQVKKMTISDYGDAVIYNGLSWDGKAYNKSKGDNELVSDGKYYYKLKSKIDYENAKEQEDIIPVTVDTTAPKITLDSSKVPGKTSYKLSFTLDEDGSGVASKVVYVNGQEIKDDQIKTTDGKHFTADVTLDEESADNEIVIGAMDYGYNQTVEHYTVSSISDSSAVVFEDLKAGQEYSYKDLTVKGKAGDKVDKLYLGVNVSDTNDTNQYTEVKIKDDRTFEQKIQLAEGADVISVLAFNKAGEKVAEYGIKVYCDTTAPVIKLESPTATEDNVIETASSKLTLKGTVSDNVFGYELKINGESIVSGHNEGNLGDNEKPFEYTTTVEDGDIITLEATDEFGNVATKKYKVKVDPSLGVTISGVSNGGIYNKDVTPKVEYDKDAYDVHATLDGKPFANGQTVSSEGDHTLAVKATAKETNKSFEKVVKFIIDKTAPDVEIFGAENGKTYNEDVTLKALVEEGATVTEFTLDGKEYDGKAVSTDGKHKASVKAADKAGNVTTKTVEFTIDKTAPVITVDGVKNHFKYDKPVTAKVSVNEETSELTVTLDGKEYKGEEISSNGKHVLKVTAVDLAGNKSEETITFTIDIKDNKDDHKHSNPGKDNGSHKDKPQLPVTNDDDAKKNANKTTGTNTKGNTKAAKSNMPKTGSLVNTSSLMVTGILLVSAGAAVCLSKRKRRN